jgi:hypothetical protein
MEKNIMNTPLPKETLSGLKSKTVDEQIEAIKYHLGAMYDGGSTINAISDELALLCNVFDGGEGARLIRTRYLQEDTDAQADGWLCKWLGKE